MTPWPAYLVIALTVAVGVWIAVEDDKPIAISRGNDLIMTGTDNDIVSGDIPGNPANHGNDIFAVGGGTVGAYYITTITDYDTRTDGADTQFDRIWINQSYDWYFDAAADGTLILVYGPDYAGMLGQIAFTGLTLADAGSVVVEGLDPMTGGPVLI